MGMMVEEQQSLEGLIEHLQDAFQSDKTLSKLISNCYDLSQKSQETENAFPDDLQVLARKVLCRNHLFI